MSNLEINWILIVITCCFMVMDIVTGFAQACKNKCVSSSVMKQGLWHKCGFLLVIMFAVLCEFTMWYLQQTLNLGFTMTLPIQTAVCIYIIVLEIASNLENIAKLSPELADKKFMGIFNGIQTTLTETGGFDKISESAAPTLDEGSNLSDSTGGIPCGGSEDIC